MNTLTLAEFAEQHRQELLTEALEYNRSAQLRRGRRRQRHARTHLRRVRTDRRAEAAAR